MLKITSIAIIGALAFAPAAFAKGHSNGNSENAKAMAQNIKTFEGSVARAISPNGGDLAQAPGAGGWGNTGSAVTGNTSDGLLDEGAVDGGQVSKRNK